MLLAVLLGCTQVLVAWQGAWPGTRTQTAKAAVAQTACACASGEGPLSTHDQCSCCSLADAHGDGDHDQAPPPEPSSSQVCPCLPAPAPTTPTRGACCPAVVASPLLAPGVVRVAAVRAKRAPCTRISGATGGCPVALALHTYCIGGAPVRGPPAVVARSQQVWYAHWVT